MKTHRISLPPARTSHAAPATGVGFARALLALALTFVFFAASPTTQAAPPEFMTYQGFLVDANGNPLAPTTPANYPVIFRIYSAPTGGARLWSEQQIVTVDKGNFSVILGEGSPVSGETPKPLLSSVLAGPANGERYMSLSVTIGADTPEMLPRLRLLPSPYAFTATSANSLVNAFGTSVVSYANSRVEVAGDLYASGKIWGDGSGLTGLTLAQLPALDAGILTMGTLPDARLSANVARRNVANAFTGNQTMTGNLGLGTLGVAFPLTIGNNTTGDKISLYGQAGNSIGFGVTPNLLQIHTDAVGADISFGYGSSAAMAETMRIKGSGSVGIGTSIPSGKLTVNGGVRARGGSPGVNGGNDNGYAFAGNNGDNDSGLFSSADGQLEFYSNAQERMRITPGGWIGINTVSPQAGLDVNGGVRIAGNNTLEFGGGISGKQIDAGKIGYGTFTADALNIVGAGTTGSNRKVKIYAEGGTTFAAASSGITVEGPNNRYFRLYRNDDGLIFEGNSMRNQNNSGFGRAIWDGDGNLDGYSDRRLKKDIVDAEPVLPRLMQVQLRRYHWAHQADKDPKKFGVIAQELKPLFPDLVGSGEVVPGEENLMTVKAAAFGLVAAKAVQELKQALDAENAALRRELGELKAEVAQLRGKQAETAQVETLQRELDGLKQIVQQLSAAHKEPQAAAVRPSSDLLPGASIEPATGIAATR